MIRITRKITEKSTKAVESLKKEKAKNGSCNTSEVNAALKEMFHGKCYICENKQITSYQIEHLVPHRENKDLKFDWNNLFLACAHCNNTKLAKYDPIIDCTKEQLALLATNGMLVKRPIIVTEDMVLVGFQEAEWEEKL